MRYCDRFDSLAEESPVAWRDRGESCLLDGHDFSNLLADIGPLYIMSRARVIWRLKQAMAFFLCCCSLSCFAQSSEEIRRMQQGQSLLQAGDAAEALKVLQDAGNSDDAYRLRVAAYISAKRNTAAILHATAWFNARRNPQALYFLATLHLDNQAIPKALGFLRRASSVPEAKTALENLSKAGWDKPAKVWTCEGSTWEAYAFGRAAPDTQFFYTTAEGATPTFMFSSKPVVRSKWFGIGRSEGHEFQLGSLYNGNHRSVAVWDTHPTNEGLCKYLQKAEYWTYQLENVTFPDRSTKADPVKEYGEVVAGYDKDMKDLPASKPYLAALAELAAAQAKNAVPNNRTLDRLFKEYPLAGRLQWALELRRMEMAEAAEKVYEDATKKLPERWESYLELANLYYWQAAEQTGQKRANLLLKVQDVLRRMPKFGAEQAALLNANLAIQLGSYGIAGDQLRKIKGENAAQAAGLLAALSQLNHDQFKCTGELKSKNGNLMLVYESSRSPPKDGSLMHHRIELAVFDRKGRLVETFAVTSQSLLPGEPRRFFLDRISGHGFETVQIYDDKPPKAMAVAKSIGAQ